MNKDIQQKIIYIAGFPRSGTTWFANILNASPNIVYRHEILGRKYKSFGDRLFQAIKFNHGLSEDEYYQAIKTIRFADIETDRPPFFKKDQFLQNHPKFHYYLWAAAKLLPFLQGVYGKLYKIRNSRNHITILLKETGASNNIDSIIKGLKIEKTLILVRAPYGAISSHIKGMNLGKMPQLTPQIMLKWFHNNQDMSYIRALNYSDNDITKLSNAAFYAINWRVYYENIIEKLSSNQGCFIYFYEALVDNPEKNIKQLFII